MPITFACEACGKSFTVADHRAGKHGVCKQCGGGIQVPAAETDAYGLEMAAPEPARPAPIPPKASVYTPAPDSRDDDRPKKKLKKKSQSRFGDLMGLGGYNNDKIRFAIGAILVVGFLLFRLWLRKSLRR